MRIKRLCSIFLALLLLFSAVTGIASAKNEAAAAQAQVLALVRERIGDTAQYEIFDSSSRSGQNGVTVYRFEWASERDEGYASLSVACTSGGVITDYIAHDSKNENAQDKPDLHKKTPQEAMVRAKALMDRLNPQLANVLVLETYADTESLYETGYSFRVQRVENGIPFYGQTGSLRVNAQLDAIESFYINYDETLPVPQAPKLISKAQAEATYAQLLSMELVYKASYENRTCTIYPVYVPAAASHMYVSATEYNTVLDMRSDYRGDGFLTNGALGDSAMKEEASVDFSAAEQAELERVEGLMSSDAVLESILKNPLLDIPTGVQKQSSSRGKNIYTGQYTYSYRLEASAEGKWEGVNITADAKTGALLRFNSYRDFAADAEPKNTTAAAEAAAKALAGTVFAEYKKDEGYVQENNVRYYRYVNGVPFRADSINVTVHPSVGKVTHFSCTYTDVQFPSVEGAMTPVQAAEAMFARVDYAPYLMAKYNADGTATVEAVYVLDERMPTSIEPFTGVLLQSYGNKPYTDTQWQGYTDIEGHYAQMQLETLARFGIRFPSGACSPDATITQAELVSLLTAAFYNGGRVTDFDAAYAEAERKALLDKTERDDTAAVTRGMAAKLLIRALGLDEVASLAGIYNCPFADVTENIGHISILNAMGVVRGDGAGSFHPEGLLTRADAAILIYNYLSR